MRSGNILYYDSIPSDVPASAYTHTQANSAITDSNQRFWKEYIDYVVGVWRDPSGTVQHPANPAMSYGNDYTFGTVQISAPPTGIGAAYMNYSDNPKRPRHRLWFGPMTMVQYMSDTGLLPGTAHDISMYPMKIGIGQALQDIQNNHPNDLVSMILFSRPLYTGGASGTGAFNLAQYSLTNNMQPMITSLWVPPNSSSCGRPPLGRERRTDASGLRRLDLEHGVQLRVHAGLQPVQRQQHPQDPGQLRPLRALAAADEWVPSGW